MNINLDALAKYSREDECAARGGGMDRKWLPLNALRAFEAAGQHLSFTAAANSLTVAQSAVSRRRDRAREFSRRRRCSSGARNSWC